MSFRDLRRHVGRLAIVGFAGESVPDDVRRLAAEFDLGGVIYFARNVVSPPQVADLSREAAALARDWPFWISVDQEGGRVARLKRGFTEWPPANTLGRSADDSLTERFAAALAAELVAVGINLDFVPVLDVHTNPANPVIGDRAMADRADDVARLGRLMVRGLQSAGVAACGKHFPGHGDTSTDSHEALPIVGHERARLEAVELVPFRAAIEEGIASIMTAHVLVPALDRDRPASMSPLVIDRLLKKTLGYTGVVFSDDLGMKAVSATMSLSEASVQAIAAGADAVLLCNSTAEEQMVALEALIRAVEDGRIPLTRIDDAFKRQQRMKTQLAGAPRTAAPLGVVGCAEHQAVANDMAAWR